MLFKTSGKGQTSTCSLYDDAIRGPITGNDNVWQYYGKKIALDGPTDEQLADWPAVRSSHMI